MAKVSIARKLAVPAAVLLLVGLGLVVLTTDANLGRTPASSSNGAGSTSATLSVTSASTSESIVFSSPVAGSVLVPGQSLNITGTVTPTPSHPDTVFIVATQQDSITIVNGVTMAVQTDGTFSYSIVISTYWPSGAYVIQVTDSNGASGSEVFLIQRTAS